MITLLLAAALLGPSAAEFFPLEVGTKWHYEERVARRATLHRDEVLAPVMVGEKMATPIASSLQGHVYDTLYYRVEGDTVYLVAYDPKKPLSMPIPILKVGNARMKWDYSGETELANEPALLTMKCESAPKGVRAVLAIDREIMELKVDATVGGSAVTGIQNRQTALYAKGVGLVEIHGEGKVGTTTTKFERKLIKFEPGKGATW